MARSRSTHSKSHVRRRCAAVAVAAATGAAALVATIGSGAASAYSGVVCPVEKPPVQVGDAGGAALEGAVVDNLGRLYVTDLFGGRVLRFDRPGATPTLIATLPGASGGGALALLNDGTLIVGSGADARVFLGDLLHPGAISRVNVTTGKLTQIASGFSAADGLAVARDGTIYATNDFGGQIGKVSPTGVATPEWAPFLSANGAVLSHDDKYLYVSRTFVNPGVSRIPIAHPNQPESLLDLTGSHSFDAPDGLTLDSADRPVVPTDVSGVVLRIEKPGVTCELASGITNSSVVVYGKSRQGFAAGHLYRAGFDGKIYEIPSGFDAVAAAAAS
ncbi:SMP-30/gluconolaconase/LRE-like protein [Jatrophihabitans sp. GAS493]|uniref:SMP-30/gluconolactonase/LRE family protein n=1 Tax=Jatrophihabitans sp. GAS493 TaxID=1907575 RepID=UPI000BB7C909|nr:SMP-30/gluconolactonase/LRE family protein [Jatrophihabitans sp. GAS493]SOD71258.1 SMP-30/gluconolaconase/LRE-like protein [Jatrophihabitans sp. GAS493]